MKLNVLHSQSKNAVSCLQHDLKKNTYADLFFHCNNYHRFHLREHLNNYFNNIKSERLNQNI